MSETDSYRAPNTSHGLYNNQFDIPNLTSLDELRQGLNVEGPIDDIIEALQADDPRIEVIRMTEQEAPAQTLAYRLLADFPAGQKVMIRSSQASLDGPITAWSNGETIVVHDIRRILEMGEIQNRMSVNLCTFAPAVELEEQHLRGLEVAVMHYAAMTHACARNTIDGRADRMFPVVLVYNPALLGYKSGYRYMLPREPSIRPQLIQKAYILDTSI